MMSKRRGINPSLLSGGPGRWALSTALGTAGLAMMLLAALPGPPLGAPPPSVLQMVRLSPARPGSMAVPKPTPAGPVEDEPTPPSTLQPQPVPPLPAKATAALIPATPAPGGLTPNEVEPFQPDEPGEPVAEAAPSPSLDNQPRIPAEPAAEPAAGPAAGPDNPPAPDARAAPVVESSRLDAGFGLVESIRPPYPSRARRLGRGGEVRVELEIAPDGEVRSARVVRETPGWGFGEVVRRAFLKARFTPPTVAGRPVSVLWRKTLRFRP